MDVGVGAGNGICSTVQSGVAAVVVSVAVASAAAVSVVVASVAVVSAVVMSAVVAVLMQLIRGALVAVVFVPHEAVSTGPELRRVSE